MKRAGVGVRRLRVLLLLLPPGFRDRFGEEMGVDFAARRAEAGARGRRAVAALWLRTVRDVAATAAREWARLSALEAGADARLALRAWRRRPAVGIVVVLVLGLAIGAAAAVVDVTRAVLLRPLPYEDGGALVMVRHRAAEGARPAAVPGPDAAAYREALSLGGLAFLARVEDAVAVAGAGESVPIHLATVTQDFFRVLGTRPAVGRDFAEVEAGDDAAAVWLVSDGFFRRALGGDPSWIGRTLRIEGRTGVIAGVLPRGFRLLLPSDAGIAADADVWAPLAVPLARLPRADRLRDQDSDDRGVVVARLAEGATVERAQAELTAIAAGVAAAERTFGVAANPLVVPLREAVVARARPVLVALLVAVFLVVLLACASAANLLLARGLERGGGMAIRSALGASRGRLIRQLGWEGGLIAVAVAVVSSGLAFALVGGVDAVRPSALPAVPIRPSFSTVVPAWAAAAVCCLVSTIIPGVHALGLPAAALRVHARSTTGRSRRLRRNLVGAQVALSFALLVGTALLLRSAASLAAQELGFQPERVVTFRTALVRPDAYRGPADRAAFVARLEDGIRAIAGVRAVGLVGALPLAGGSFTQPYWTVGSGGLEPEGEANVRVVTPGFFAAMGTRVLEGRGFRPEDDRQDRRVVVVDERLARLVARYGTAVGRVLRLPVDGALVDATVVGVTESVRYESLVGPVTETIYVPYRHEASRHIGFVVRTDADPIGTLARTDATLRALDPLLAPFGARTLRAIVQDASAPTRLALGTLAGFALAATLVAIVGLYATVRGAVRARTRELGVRLALGARPRALLVDATLEGLAPCLGGLVAGLLPAVALVRGLRSLLFGVRAADGAMLGATTVLLAGACIVACLLGARRALSVDPVRALGSE